jgi:hypothetical protein
MQTYTTKYGPMTCYNNDIVFSSMLRRGLVYERGFNCKQNYSIIETKTK